MMVIRHVAHPGAHVRDAVGARQDVLVWGYGVSTGHVAAVHVREDGSADIVVEFERPEPIVVSDDVCERVQSCRFDRRCPFVDSCELHARE